MQLPTDIWQQFRFFFSSTHSQHYLHTRYQKQHIEHAEKKSFDNCYPFIYYLEHGENYYRLAEHSPLSVKPVLLFYGMTQLIKACLLTIDPNYPESTAVLAHGLTTRKRKKQHYEFLQDEVKTQKNGLFSHTAERLFNLKHTEGEKYEMEILLSSIPELRQLFFLSSKQKKMEEVVFTTNNELRIPSSILDAYHMTESRFTDYLSSLTPIITTKEPSTNGFLNYTITAPLTDTFYCSPFSYDNTTESYFLSVNKKMNIFLPELLTHYLLLYNLSMISRYETEWWSNLLHNYETRDYPFIYQFLHITTSKVPYLIHQFLLTKRDVN